MYWTITLEYTDLLSENSNFIKTLKLVVDFIDSSNKDMPISDRYKQLQDIVIKEIPKNEISNRKAINQCVKLGFVSPLLLGYANTKDFLASSGNFRKVLLTEIIYNNNNFMSSVTEDIEKINHVKIAIKTIEENDGISSEEFAALMLTEPNASKNYFTRDELINVIENRNDEVRDLIENKYNQINYFQKILKLMIDIELSDTFVKIQDDNDLIPQYKKCDQRDPYLQRVYKAKLKDESDQKCMIEDLKYPSLIASHIKPYINCDEKEAFDRENGLLLSRNMDILFDKGNISFEDNGKIKIHSKLDDNLKAKLQEYKLLPEYITEKRLEYISYHRDNIFKG